MDATNQELNGQDTVAPFLPPVEAPKDPGARQAYEMTSKYFGKVFTPLKVFSARMPWEFYSNFYGQISDLDRKLEIGPEKAMLIRQQVARLNVCEFCIDSNRAGTIQASMDQAKFDALDSYDTSEMFDEAERSMLDYATKLTKEKKMDRGTFDRMKRHFTDRQVCEIVYVVASEHVYNMTNIGLNIRSDMICDIMKGRRQRP